MKNQVKALKVKIKSLAAEAKIIRLEERRVLGHKKPDPQLYNSLREHRLGDVRKEQRSAMLAYGFIRGRKYHEIERPGAKPWKRTYPDPTRVLACVNKFGGLPYSPAKFTREDILAWWAVVLEMK